MAVIGQWLLYAAIIGWALYVAWVFFSAFDPDAMERWRKKRGQYRRW
jgi:hypothetical protein